LLAVHNQLLERNEFLMEIREQLLLQAQQQYKMYHDHAHHTLDFEVGGSG
jgi:hypothetical protein